MYLCSREREKGIYGTRFCTWLVKKICGGICNRQQPKMPVLSLSVQQAISGFSSARCLTLPWSRRRASGCAFWTERLLFFAQTRVLFMSFWEDGRHSLAHCCVPLGEREGEGRNGWVGGTFLVLYLDDVMCRWEVVERQARAWRVQYCVLVFRAGGCACRWVSEFHGDMKYTLWPLCGDRGGGGGVNVVPTPRVSPRDRKFRTVHK